MIEMRYLISDKDMDEWNSTWELLEKAPPIPRRNWFDKLLGRWKLVPHKKVKPRLQFRYWGYPGLDGMLVNKWTPWIDVPTTWGDYWYDWYYKKMASEQPSRAYSRQLVDILEQEPKAVQSPAEQAGPAN